MFDLKSLAKDLKLSQNELSNMLGVSQTAVSLVYNGKMDLPVAWEEVLKEKINVDISKYYINKSDPSDVTQIYKSKDPAVNSIIENLSEANKIIAESNRLLSESNKVLSESISKAIEIHNKVMEQLLLLDHQK